MHHLYSAADVTDLSSLETRSLEPVPNFEHAQVYIQTSCMKGGAGMRLLFELFPEGFRASKPSPENL